MEVNLFEQVSSKRCYQGKSRDLASESGTSLESDDAYLNRASTTRPQPEDYEGYLMKKSPAMFTGWQKRYFVLKEPGEMSYWVTVSVLRVIHEFV